MGITLRVLLIISSICVFLFAIKKIKQSKLKVEDSIIWIIGAILLILASIFVNAVSWISSKLGFISPSNCVFAIIILFLLIVNFGYSLKFSILNEKIKNLNHYIALKEHEEKRNHHHSSDRSRSIDAFRMGQELVQRHGIEAGSR